MTLAGLSMDFSQFEQSDGSDVEGESKYKEPTLIEALNYEMPFGKHRGKSLKELLHRKSHRNYLRYIQSWDELENPCKANIDAVMEAYNDYQIDATRTSATQQDGTPIIVAKSRINSDKQLRRQMKKKKKKQ